MGKRSHKQRPPPRPVEDWDHNNDDDDDEEIDEDEAFNSDDERKYGSFFGNDGGDEDDQDESGSGEDEDEDDEDDSGSDEEEEDSDDDSQAGDGGQYMLDLLDKLSASKSNQSNNDNNHQEDNDRKLAAHVKESEFSASVVKPAGLTLDSLMEGIKDTKGFGALAKSMKQVESGQAAATPLPRVQQERLERQVHYNQQSKKISEWTHVVQENRQAESLDFRPQERLQVTKDMMVDSFQPKTDFEKELDAALTEAGQKDEDAILKAEEKALTDELETNKITLEEFKRRRGQLAKMRALMFYHEQKRHHINKIKSKKYRRIRKRQRERLREAEALENPDVEQELKEKEEVERIKERMTLAHKNTSKWARRVLKRGKNVDVDTRRALSAQLKRGDDLLKKMKGDSDDEDDSDEDLAETARKVLQDAEQDEGEEGHGKGLFKLAFMQRGIQKERERAKEEARQLLLELEADQALEEQSGGSDDDDEDSSRPAKKKLKAASAKEMKQVLKDGEMIASGLTFGNSTSLSVSGSIPVNGITIDPKVAASSIVSEHSSTIAGAKATDDPEKDTTLNSKNNKKNKKNKKRSSDAASAPETGDEPMDSNLESNPWMIHQEKEKSAKQVPKKKKQRVMVNVDRAVDLLDQPQAGVETPRTTDRGSAVDSVGGSADPKEDDSEKKLTSMTQAELVRKAFAVDQDNAMEEFEKEKEKVRDEEADPTRKAALAAEKDKLVSGWGSWTGMGSKLPPLKKNNKKLPAKLQAPHSKKKELVRPRQDDGRAHLIVRERRMKKLANTHMLHQIPHPYTSREEYEQSMMGGVGSEWNVTGTVSQLTRPAVQTAAGRIIQPLALSAKKRGLRPSRPAAKF